MANEPMSQSEAAKHREMYARSRDTIRVYNPLDTDFRFKWDSVWNKVPAKSTKDMEAYLAGQFFKTISVYIINKMALEKGQTMLQERKDKGLAEILDKYDEQRLIWDKVPTTDNRELLESIGNQVILGLVEEFGSEIEPEEERDIRKPSTDTIEEQVTAGLLKKRIVDSSTAPEKKPLIKVNPKLAKEVSLE